MKVAVSAQGNDTDSLVDPRFGRARWLIIVDLENGAWQAFDNDANSTAAGAGVQTAAVVTAQGAKAIITGNVGPNAHKALTAAGIAIRQAGNGVSVRDALAARRRGELASLGAPTVGGPWS